MFGKKKKYKHNADNIYKACGVTKKELNKKIKELNKYILKISKKGDTQMSKVIEKIENDFTKRELSLLTYILNYYTQSGLDESKDDVPHPEFG
jgi:hypothetical protein